MERGDPADGDGQPLDWGEWVPRLIRYYGGDVETWLRVPLRWVRCCLEMYPRLQAEEALAGAAVGAAGDAQTNQQSRKRIMAAWERALPRRAPQRKQLTADEFADYMRTLGMEAADEPGQPRH